MAIEKTILSVELYDNVLTEKAGDYTGKVQITGTLHNKEIAQRIVKERTEYRQETIENILNLADQKKLEAIAEGKSLVDGVGQFLLNISGSFDGEKSSYRSDENKIGVSFTPSSALFSVLKEIRVNARIATVGPVIDSFTDSKTKAVNGAITSGSPAIIAGNNLQLKGEDPSVGVYFTPESGGEAVKVDLVVTNTKSQIIISVPQLPDGQYYLSVTTQFGPNYTTVKVPRTYKFPILLTVGGSTPDENPDDL